MALDPRFTALDTRVETDSSIIAATRVVVSDLHVPTRLVLRKNGGESWVINTQCLRTATPEDGYGARFVHRSYVEPIYFASNSHDPLQDLARAEARFVELADAEF